MTYDGTTARNNGLARSPSGAVIPTAAKRGCVDKSGKRSDDGQTAAERKLSLHFDYRIQQQCEINERGEARMHNRKAC